MYVNDNLARKLEPAEVADLREMALERWHMKKGYHHGTDPEDIFEALTIGAQRYDHGYDFCIDKGLTLTAKLVLAILQNSPIMGELKPEEALDIIEYEGMQTFRRYVELREREN